MQTAKSGTDHTVTTNKNKLIHRKLISSPLPFQQTTTAPAKRITTQQNEQPSCSKTLDTTTAGGYPCIYTRKETPRPINHERSEDWLKKKEHPKNSKGQFTSPNKNSGEKVMDLNLSIVSDEEFDSHNKSDGKPVHTNINDELQLLPKDNKLTPGQGIYTGINKIAEPQPSVRRSRRLPFAKQTEKLGVIPYQTSNNKKKQTINGSVLQEKTTTTTKNNEEENHRSVRQETKEIRTIRYYNNYKPPTTDQTRRGGNVTYADMTSKLSTVNTDIRQRDISCY